MRPFPLTASIRATSTGANLGATSALALGFTSDDLGGLIDAPQYIPSGYAWGWNAQTSRRAYFGHCCEPR